MSIWDNVSDVTSGVLHGFELVAEGATNRFQDEVHQIQLFGQGMITGAILNPVNGVEQIINNVAGTELPPLEFSNQKEVNNSLAGKIGMVGGTIATFVLTDGAAGALLGVEAGSIATLAVAGAVQGGVFTPSDNSKRGGDFFLDRIGNAAIDAATFAVMGGVAGKLGHLYEPAAGLTTRMAQSAFINGVGGAASGLVNSEATAIIKEGRLANIEEVGNAVITGTAFGAGFGAGTVALEAAVQAAKGPLKPGDDVRSRLNRGFENPDQVAKQIDVKSEVSQRFVNQVADTMDKLPQDVRRFISDENIRVRAVKQVTDMDPGLKGVKPEGWNSGTFENADGMYRRDMGAVVSEYRLNDNGVVVKSDRIPGTTRHEIGHGVDDLLQKYSKKASRFSQEPTFKNAHFDDWTKLPVAQQTDDFWYFINGYNEKAGRGEAFAELFSGVTGGSTNTKATQEVMNAFPKTTQVVREKLNNLPAFKPPVKNYAQP